MKNKFRIIILSLIISFNSFSQFDIDVRNQHCFDKSVDRIGQRYVDWECGKDSRVVNCNEKLESDPGSSIVLHAKSKKPFTGSCETCHMNGIRERIVSFQDGKVHGTDTTTYESGCLQVVRTHIDGVENGTWTYYNDSSGLEAWTINFFNGERHGMAIFYSHELVGTDNIDIKIGNTSKKHTYGIYESDTLKVEYYQNGKLHGKKTEYFKGSKIYKEINYENGQLNGPFIIYNEEGTILEDLNYALGKKHGLCQYYFEDGTLLKVENWSNGIKAGEFKYFYIQGFIQSKESYNKKGQRDGEFEERYPDDKIKKRSIYKKDVLIEEHVFDQYGNEIRTFGVESETTDEDDLVAVKKKKKWWQFWKRK